MGILVDILHKQFYLVEKREKNKGEKYRMGEIETEVR